MPRIDIVKGGSVLPDPYDRIAQTLSDCVNAACRTIAFHISSMPDAVFGTDTRVGRNSGSASSAAALTFSNDVVAPHANAYARHFFAEVGKTTRMDVGNLVEQIAAQNLAAAGYIQGQHFLYQSSLPQLPDFPLSYMGASKSARPDFRFPCPLVGCEVVFDITTPAQSGHLIQKQVGAMSLWNHPSIPLAVEIVWLDADFYA